MIRWKKDLFSSNYKLLKDGNIRGYINCNPFSRKITCGMGDKKFIVKEAGFLNCNSIIYAAESRAEIGQIHYNFWRTKANLILQSGKVYDWTYTNFSSTRWKLSGENVEINYADKCTSGEVVSSTTDEELFILSGLLIRNYYVYQLTITLLVVFIVIFSTAINHSIYK